MQLMDLNHSCQHVEMRGRLFATLAMAMFTSNLIQFNPHTFDNVSLELIPRVLEFVQQEMGQSGFGVNRAGQRNIEYCRTRVCEV